MGSGAMPPAAEDDARHLAVATVNEIHIQGMGCLGWPSDACAWITARAQRTDASRYITYRPRRSGFRRVLDWSAALCDSPAQYQSTQNKRNRQGVSLKMNLN